jgi:hypothetical protein
MIDFSDSENQYRRKHSILITYVLTKKVETVLLKLLVDVFLPPPLWDEVIYTPAAIIPPAIGAIK